MFTGTIETTGSLSEINNEAGNLHLTIQSNISQELKIDQSVSHNGICLTVVKVNGQTHTVTAIAETIARTDIAAWQVGHIINLERCMPANGRFDGHIVQGHVDTVALCKTIEETNGSWLFTFTYTGKHITVEKGSITVNGISLTVVNSQAQQFSVAIIPYTFANTNLHALKTNGIVNLEFDIVGKYMQRIMELR